MPRRGTAILARRFIAGNTEAYIAPVPKARLIPSYESYLEERIQPSLRDFWNPNLISRR